MRPDIFLATIGRGSNGSNALEVSEDRAAVTAESQDNIINRVNNVSQYGPSWHYVPGIGVAGTAYAEVPGSALGDLAFTRASSKTRTNSAGVVETIAANVPPHDYRNADGTLSTFPRLNLEPQRSNIALQSETFSSATWAKSNATISADVTTAPNGTNTADKLVDNSVNDQHRIDQTSASVIGTNVFSVYAKKAERSFIQLRVGLSGAYFDLNTGTTGGISAGITASIQDAGNGWYRCTIIRVSTVANEVLRINLATAINTNNFIGDGTSGAFIWGAQFEAGAFPTTYIGATTTSAVTRLADTAIDTTATSLIGQTEGTLFMEFRAQLTGANQSFSISNGTTTQRVDMRINTANQFVTVGNFGGSTEFNIIGGTATAGGRFKIAMAYKANDAVLYVNGTQIGTDNSVAVSGTFTRIGFDLAAGTQPFNSPVTEAAVIPTRLPNATLAQLTTL